MAKLVLLCIVTLGLLVMPGIARLWTDDPSIWGIAFIVAFAYYPFGIAAIASTISKWSDRHHWTQRFAIVFALIGIAPAIWLNYPNPKVMMVGPLAGIVLVLSFSATGALAGSLLDLMSHRKRQQAT